MMNFSENENPTDDRKMIQEFRFDRNHSFRKEWDDNRISASSCSRKLGDLGLMGVLIPTPNTVGILIWIL